MDRATAHRLALAYAKKHGGAIQERPAGGFLLDSGPAEIDFEAATGVLRARAMVFRYAGSLTGGKVAELLTAFALREADTLGGGRLEVAPSATHPEEEPWLHLSVQFEDPRIAPLDFMSRVDALAAAAYIFRRSRLNALLHEVRSSPPSPPEERKLVPPAPPPAAELSGALPGEPDDSADVLARMRYELIFLGLWRHSAQPQETTSFEGWFQFHYLPEVTAPAPGQWGIPYPHELLERVGDRSARLSRLAMKLADVLYVPNEDDLRFRLAPPPSPPSYRDFPEDSERVHYARGSRNAAALVHREMEIAGLWWIGEPDLSEWESMNAPEQDGWGLQVWLGRAPHPELMPLWREAAWWSRRFSAAGYDAVAAALDALSAAFARLWELVPLEVEAADEPEPEPEPLAEPEPEPTEGTFTQLEEDAETEWPPDVLDTANLLQTLHEEMRRACPRLDHPPPLLRFRASKLERSLRELQDWLTHSVFLPLNETRSLPPDLAAELRRWAGVLEPQREAARVVARLREAATGSPAE